jgi:DNA-binding NarL/FixJ family response regulator
MLRILIADDAQVVRSGMKHLLESHQGWTVCGEAVDGQDAIEKARTLNPDVILLDISMPRLDGLRAAEQISKILPSAKIYIVTQHHSLEMARYAADAGARGFIAKMCIPTDLIPAIEADTGRIPAEAETKP